jgi:hypothetical protein
MQSILTIHKLQVRTASLTFLARVEQTVIIKIKFQILKYILPTSIQIHRDEAMEKDEGGENINQFQTLILSKATE